MEILVSFCLSLPLSKIADLYLFNSQEAKLTALEWSCMWKGMYVFRYLEVGNSTNRASAPFTRLGVDLKLFLCLESLLFAHEP